jgi:hypothetical protein
MQETINKKDECIAQLKGIIEQMRGQRGKESGGIRSRSSRPGSE